MSDTILFCEMNEDWQIDNIKDALSDLDLSPRFTELPLHEVDDNTLREARYLSVFISSECNSDTLSRFPDLEFISTRSTGFDHVDLDYCRQNNIEVSNVPTYGENTVAEHTFALILSLSRNLHEAMERTRRGEFNMEQLRGFDLRGKTIGVIGTGHIGIHVIRMARGFGMDVVAYDIEHNSFMAELLGFDYVDLDHLLESSDIISLHVPLNDHTRHMIDREELEQCRDEALIINTARGALVNTDALLDCLEAGNLNGAGLDVLEGEEMLLSDIKLNEKEFSRDKLARLIQNDKLIKRDDVIFTPHMAYNSKEAIERILNTTVENIQSYLQGNPKNTVRD
ncbi:MAG: NAD(P)-dependent oxidoreductase [bacterium]